MPSEPADPTMGLVQFRGVGVNRHSRHLREQRCFPAKDAVEQPTAQKVPCPLEIRVQRLQSRPIKHVGLWNHFVPGASRVKFRVQKAVFDVLMAVCQGEHQLICSQSKPSVLPQNLDQLRLVSGAKVVLDSLLQSS